MISKRLIGVITVKDNIAVQSFGYKRYLPLGDPKILVKNLDRWGVDEILINVIDRYNSNSGPDFELLSKINLLNINTPIIYGGGINNLNNAKSLICHGADRLLIEKILIHDYFEFKKIYEAIGSQSLILSIPTIVNFSLPSNFKLFLFFPSINSKGNTPIPIKLDR